MHDKEPQNITELFNEMLLSYFIDIFLLLSFPWQYTHKTCSLSKTTLTTEMCVLATAFSCKRILTDNEGHFAVKNCGL